MKIPAKTIIKYIRKGKRVPYGVIVAVKRPDGEISVDYALCKKGDRFTKDMALEIAIGRAMNLKGKNDESCSRNLPHSVMREIDKFNERAAKYYRTSVDEICTW